MRVERTVTIDRSPEEVFEYLATPENDPTWAPAIRSHERSSPGPIGVGTRTRMELSLLGRTATYDWEVTEYESPRLLAYRTTSGPLPATVRFRLVPVDGGTRLAHAVETEPRGVYYRALASLMPGAIGRILEGMLGNLKDRLEGKPATASREPGAAPSGAMVGAIVVAAVAIASLLLLRRRRRSGKR
jgi:uncharacterized protein YndB with AHSA1/START domain